MATSLKNTNNPKGLPDASKWSFVLVVSAWNDQVTESLYAGAVQTLLDAGVSRENLQRMDVPGSFELSLGAQWAAQRAEVDAVICLGCVIQGETPHFDYICQACAHGITEVALKYDKPVIFGVLTTNNQKQALERAGGKYGNKGEEAAITALQMLNIK